MKKNCNKTLLDIKKILSIFFYVSYKLRHKATNQYNYLLLMIQKNLNFEISIKYEVFEFY